MRTRLLTLALVAILTGSAFADEVQLRGGDRYTGTVVSLAGGTLTFKATHGELKIPWAEVTSLTSTTPLRIKIGNQPETTITAIAPGAAPGSVTLTPGGAANLADIGSFGPLTPPIVITGGANAGFLQTSGNSSINTLRLDGDVSVRQGANRYRGNAAVNRAENDDLLTAKNWTSGLNYDRFLTKKLFATANAIFTNDDFRDLDLRTALGAGLGYQVIDTTRVKLTANGGVGWVKENFAIAEDNDYTALREGAALDVFLVPNRVALFHKHDGYFGVTGEDNLFFKMQNGIRLSVVAGLVTTLEWDLDYDKSPSPGRENSDKTFSLTFGYRF